VSTHELRFLVLAPTGRDGRLTCSLLRRAGLDCHECVSVEELLGRAEKEGAAGLLIAEEALLPSAFVALSALLERQSPWSDIPLLLFTGQSATTQTRPPNSRLLVSLGNVTLLDRPLRPMSMISAAQSALRARRRQYATRDELVQREQAVKQRDEFLAMLGHELRNPLGAILIAVELMDRTSGRDPKHRAVVRHQASNLSRLVDDLLDVSRVTSGKIALQRTRVDMAELVARCIQSMEMAIKAQRLQVAFTPSGPLPVDGDRVRLEQVVVNLLNNAIKYTPSGGLIDVCAGLVGNNVVLRVQDSGVGIAPEVIGSVFDLFAQAPGTLDRAKGGMGIGLTLVRSLVDLHGGTVTAESGGLGKGSAFTVRLPRSAGSSLAAPMAQPPVPAPAANGRDVLIVEDNADSRDMLCALLEGYGHRVEAVGDGLSAVTRAVAHRPSVLVVDIGLPGLDGYQVAQQVRQALGASVYLVALTGYGQPEDQRRAREAGFDVHFTKPVDLNKLITQISQV
jgi:signal transduction histidine kinase/CheY-like chemotaxis protein